MNKPFQNRAPLFSLQFPAVENRTLITGAVQQALLDNLVGDRILIRRIRFMDRFLLCFSMTWPLGKIWTLLWWLGLPCFRKKWDQISEEWLNPLSTLYFWAIHQLMRLAVFHWRRGRIFSSPGVWLPSSSTKCEVSTFTFAACVGQNRA